MGKRVVAVVGALALVAAALFVRHALSDRGNGDGGPGAGTDGGHGGPPVVACTPDLADICQALADDGVIVTGTRTLDLADAAKQPADVDGWITWSPAPIVANYQLDPSGREGWRSPEALRSAPLGLATSDNGRSDLMNASCDLSSPDVGSCLAQAAADGDVSLGVGGGQEAESVARLAFLASDLVDNSGNADRGAIGAITSGAPSSGTAREQAISQTRPGLGADVVVGPAPLLREIARSEQGQTQGLEVKTEPEMLSVVVASHGPVDLDKVVEAAGDAKLADRWAGVGLTDEPPSNRNITADAGKLYQVWQAAP